MIISDNIARMIEALIEESGGTIELKRNVMAEQLGCAPSQINYVIMSRFTPERGYIIESKRGGGGYIRIVRKALPRNDLLVRVLHSIGDALEEAECASLLQALASHDAISSQDIALLSAALSQASLSPAPSRTMQAALRASILRQMLLTLMQ